jgi:hypothetical protein
MHRDLNGVLPLQVFAIVRSDCFGRFNLDNALSRAAKAGLLIRP